MRPIRNFEYQRMQDSFKEEARNLTQFGIIVRYTRAAYRKDVDPVTNNNGTLVPAESATWVEDGFFGYLDMETPEYNLRYDVAASPGGAPAVLREVSQKITLKMPLDGLHKPLKVLNPKAPASVQGRHFYFRAIDPTTNLIETENIGTIIAGGIVIRDVWGRTPYYGSGFGAGTVFGVNVFEALPTEQVDGVVLPLMATTDVGSSAWLSSSRDYRWSVNTPMDYRHKMMVERYGENVVKLYPDLKNLIPGWENL